MAADKLCRRVDNDIRPVFKWTQLVWRSKGAIHYQRDIMLMRNSRHSLDIDKIRIRIANRQIGRAHV